MLGRYYRVRSEAMSKGHHTVSPILARLTEDMHRELPRTRKGFRCQYDQDAILRALQKAFNNIVAPNEQSPQEPNDHSGQLRFLARWYERDRAFPNANHSQIALALYESAEAI